MEFTIHLQVLAMSFAIALVVGAVAGKTGFCTMGAVSDWVNMGDTGRLRAWLLAMAIALAGVVALEAGGLVKLEGDTFPPYRAASFSWLRYLLGGLMFGVGMTLAGGCGKKTLVRIGGGSLKSVVVLIVMAVFAHQMMWGELYARAFEPWIAPATLQLDAYGIHSRELSSVVAAIAGVEPGRGLHVLVGAALALALLAFVFSSRDFRTSRDNILGGAVVGAAVVAGWYVTGGSMGAQWRDYALFATEMPSRVQAQSFTFVSPMGDAVRYLLNPGQLSLVTFGIVALAGVILGAFLYALAARRFRIEWFRTREDAAHHVLGAALMGTGGVLAMGCTIGQAITGFSTLAIGSVVVFASIVAGSALAMKYLYWRATRS